MHHGFSLIFSFYQNKNIQSLMLKQDTLRILLRETDSKTKAHYLSYYFTLKSLHVTQLLKMSE